MHGRVFDIVYVLVALVTLPRWSRRARGGWAQRFGRTPPLTPDDRPTILLHGVSVGEVAALRALVPLLADRARVVVSATTDTGLARARELYGDTCEVVRFPLDASFAVGRFLDAVRPDAVGLVELELWPNFLAACRRRGVPVAVVNGRISERSFGGYRRLRRVLRGSFGSLAWVGAQDTTYASRFCALGVPPDRVSVTGTMKWDSARPMGDGGPSPQALALRRAMGIDPGRPLVVAGSTAGGEEALLHRACPAGAQLLCAPRRPERFDEAAAALPGCVRRSSGVAGAGAVRFLLDSLGELSAAYELADVVVLGRSFGPVDGRLQGSDPMEPAALGKALVTGPAHANFATVVASLAHAGGLVVADAEGLGGVLAELVGSVEARAQLGSAAAGVARASRGASGLTADRLLGLCDRAASGMGA